VGAVESMTNRQDAKALSSAIKDRRKDRAAKYAVPLPKVRGIAEEGELSPPRILEHS